jgi:Ca2+-transporting ATPase
MERSHAAAIPAYRQTADDVATALGTNTRSGLRDDEARARLAQYGPDELVAGKPRSAWRRFLTQFKDALVILLLVATAISTGLWIYERDGSLPYEALAIFVVVLLNAAMGYV